MNHVEEILFNTSAIMSTLKFYSSGVDVFEHFTFVYLCVSPYSQVVLGRIVESSHLKKKGIAVIDNN